MRRDMHTYVDTCIDIHTHRDIHTYVDMWTQACMNIDIHTYVYTCISTWMIGRERSILYIMYI
jgi:hypothetical protein